MINYKELAENILSDLMGNTSISDILLKVKIFAAQKQDNDLLVWVKKELEGYDDKPAEYRLLDSSVKVVVFIPFRGNTSVDFPVDIIKNQDVINRLSKMAFYSPIAEIEEMTKTGEGSASLQCKVPVAVYSFLSPFIHGNIQDVYQQVSKAAAAQIVVSVKSILIDYLLKISNEEDINFNTFINDKQRGTMNIENFNGIMQNGNGVLNAPNTNIISGDNVAIQNAKESLQNIVEEIEKLTSKLANDDLAETISDIKNDLRANNTSFPKLKYAFKAIPSFLMGTTTGVVANGITPLVQKAIGIISTLM